MQNATPSSLALAEAINALNEARKNMQRAVARRDAADNNVALARYTFEAHEGAIDDPHDDLVFYEAAVQAVDIALAAYQATKRDQDAAIQRLNACSARVELLIGRSATHAEEEQLARSGA
jgi:hypothetical protein